MFCGKCGNNNPAGVEFCSNCGAPLPKPSAENAAGGGTPQGFNQPPQGFNQPPQGFNQPPQGFNQPSQQPFNRMNGMQRGPLNKKLIGIGAGVLAVIIVVLIFVIKGCSGSGASSPQAAADKFAKGVNSNNTRMMVEAMMPEKMISAAEKLGGMDIDNLADELNTENVSNVSITITGNADDDDMLNDIDQAKAAFELMGVKMSEVTAKNITIKYTQDGERNEDETTAIFYKADGKWYMFPDM